MKTLGEGAIASARQLMAVLQRKSPDTVKRLAAASDPDVIDVEIIEEVKRVAAADPEVQSAVNATAAALLQQPGGMTNINFGKAANVGVVLNQTNTF